MDVIEIDGASNTGVDDVRELRENTRYQPTICRFKIFIIDEVHMLSTNAFNALLKTLEEPPPHVKFIFATTEPHKIPITILSRCQRYDFKRIPTPIIIERLKSILDREKVVIDDEGLLLISRAAEGGMRDALSLTDQVLSFAPEHATAKDVAEILGLIDRHSIMRAVIALIKGHTKEALAEIDEAYRDGHDLKQLIDGIAEEMRHLSIASTLGSVKGLVDLSVEDIASIDAIAAENDAADLQRLFAMALDGIDQIARSTEPRLAAELVFLRMADRPKMAEAVTIGSAIARLEALSRGEAVPQNAVLPNVARPAPPPQSAKKEEPSPIEPPASALLGIDQKWLNFVQTISLKSPVLGSHLEHGRFSEEVPGRDGPTLRVHFSHKLHFDAVNEGRSQPQFRALLVSHFGYGSTMEPILKKTDPDEADSVVSISEAKDLATQKAQEDLEATAKADPIVQKALSLFGGEIRAVKREMK